MGTSVRTWRQPAREIPVMRAVDVIVAGGGTAGLGAAVAAARHGAQTLLIERDGCLGGAATSGLVALFGSASAFAHGIGKEVVDRLIANGASGGAFTQFEPEDFKLLALEMIQECQAQVLLHTPIVEPIVDGTTIRGVILSTKRGPSAVLAKVVIDATGDADIAALSGAPTVSGRECDGKMRPISLLFRLGGIDCKAVVKWAQEHPEEFSPDPNRHVIDFETGLMRIEGYYGVMENLRQRGEIDENIHFLRFEHCNFKTGIVLVNNTRVYGVDGTKAEDLTFSQVKARQQMMQLIPAIRKHIPGCENAFLIDAAASVGVRETRRVIGDYILTEEDIAKNTHFDDAISEELQRGAPGHECHSPDAGEGSVRDIRYREITWQVHKYEIPFRSLLPKGIEGLLVAGRCMSTDHQADGWTRCQVVCLVTGQACGTAGALAANQGVPPRKVNVKELQRLLAGDGVRLPSTILQKVEK